MARSARSLKLFYSYAHEDEELRNKLEDALSLLKRQKLIEEWHDRKITGGKEWAGQIDDNLTQADIVLLLISRDFMASDYCSEVELKIALDRHRQKLARVVPIILRETDWETADFAKLNCLPTDGKAITSWDDEDAAFKNVAQGIRKIVEELRESDAKEPGAWPVVSIEPLRRHRARAIAGGLAIIVALCIGYAWFQSRALATKAEAKLDIGDYKGATEDFRRALIWNPFSHRAKNGISIADVALTRAMPVNFARGVAELERRMPNDPNVHVLRGDLAYYDKRAGDALKQYEGAYKLRPSLSEAFFRSGVIFSHRGSFVEAQQAFERALKASPAAAEVPRYRNNLAFVLAKLGKQDEAIDLYGQNAEYPLSAIEAARLFMQRGELKRARDSMQLAINWLRDDRVADAWYNQGPWDLETSKEGVQLAQRKEKLCYAVIGLAATRFLLGDEESSRRTAKEAMCSGAADDVSEIISWDLDAVRKANSALLEPIERFRTQVLNQLN